MQISAIQCDVSLKDPAANLAMLKDHVQRESESGSQLVVFPECFATGYCFESQAEARKVAQPVDCEFTQSVVSTCRQHQCYVVFGMLEEAGNDLFNTAVLVGQDGVVGSYRKVHLPFLGVDRFASPGDRPFEVFEAAGVRIGMLICYDAAFPEAVRALALLGADLVVLPTNWPPGSEQMAKFGVNTRSMENAIYFLAANRVGIERGFQFIGGSRISDPGGNTLNCADHAERCTLRATIDVAQSRRKRITRVPGLHVIDRFADRRPEMYGLLCEPHSLRPPGREDEAC